MFGRVNLQEVLCVLAPPLFEQVLFAGNGPEVVDGRLFDGGDAGDEHRAAVGLDADGRAPFAVDSDLAVERRALRVADDDVAERSALKADDGHGRVFDLYVRMVQVGPVAEEFFDWTHHPLKNV